MNNNPTEPNNNVVVGGQKEQSGLWANKKLVASIFVVVFALVGGATLISVFAANKSVTVFSSSTVPKVIDDGDGAAVELGMKFQSDKPGKISGVRFYKSALNTGKHVGNLWSANGTLLATATFTNESNSGWQQVNFSNPVQIQANTVYVASYHTNTGHYSDDPSSLKKGIDASPLHVRPDSRRNGPNGVFAYGKDSTFPTNGWRASNYYVDVAFTADTPAPSTGGGGTSTGGGSSSSGSGSTTSTNPVSSAGNISVEQKVATHQSSPSNSISSPRFSTTQSNELIEAFLTSDGKYANNVPAIINRFWGDFHLHKSLDAVNI